MSTENSVKISQLTKVEDITKLKNNQWFLAIDPTTASSWKNVQIKYQTISNDIGEKAIAKSKEYTDTQITALQTSFNSKLANDINTYATSPINLITANANSMPSLTAVYQKGRETAALSIVNLSNELLTKQTGKLDMLSTGLSTLAKAYVDEKIQVVNVNVAKLTSDVGSLNTSLTNLTTKVNNLTDSVSTATQLGTAFGNVNTRIANVEDTVGSLSTSPATDSKLGLIQLGFNNAGNCYGVKLNANNQAYIELSGGGGGDGEPDGWYEVKEYVLTSLKPTFGSNCLKYYSTVNVLSNAITAITDKFEQKLQYSKDTFSVNDEYHVIVLDNKYSGKDEEYYYIVKDQTIVPIEEQLIVDNPELENKKYIEIVDATAIHAASSVDLSEQTYIDEDGEEHDISLLNKYNIILTPDNIYVVKENGSSKRAETAVVSNACYIAPSQKYEAKYIAYIDINYSIGKALRDFSQLKYDFIGSITEVIEKSIDEFVNDYSQTKTFYNTSSIEIQPNSTKHIAITIDSIAKYTPIAIKNITVDNINILTTSASIFNNNVYITLLNNSNNTIILQTNKISSEVQYIRVAV